MLWRSSTSAWQIFPIMGEFVRLTRGITHQVSKTNGFMTFIQNMFFKSTGQKKNDVGRPWPSGWCDRCLTPRNRQSPCGWSPDVCCSKNGRNAGVQFHLTRMQNVAGRNAVKSVTSRLNKLNQSASVSYQPKVPIFLLWYLCLLPQPTAVFWRKNGGVTRWGLWWMVLLDGGLLVGTIHGGREAHATHLAALERKKGEEKNKTCDLPKSWKKKNNHLGLDGSSPFETTIWLLQQAVIPSGSPPGSCAADHSKVFHKPPMRLRPRKVSSKWWSTTEKIVCSPILVNISIYRLSRLIFWRLKNRQGWKASSSFRGKSSLQNTWFSRMVFPIILCF